MLARVLLNEGDQPNVFIPTFDNARKVAQKELESEYVCSNNCYSQFTEDEMYSIRLQLAELGEPNIVCTNVNIQRQPFVRVGFKIYKLAMISYFNKHSLPGKCYVNMEV